MKKQNDPQLQLTQKPNLMIQEVEIENQLFCHYKITNVDSGVFGFGSGLDSRTAQTKALYEYIERVVFFQLAEVHKWSTTSGCAAHSLLSGAEKNSRLELLERGGALAFWYLQLGCSLLKEVLILKKFPIQIYVIYNWENTPVYAALFELPEARMILTCCSSSTEDAIMRLSADCEKAYLLLAGISKITNPLLKLHYEIFSKLNSQDMNRIFWKNEPVPTTPPTVDSTTVPLLLWTEEPAYFCRASSNELLQLQYGNELYFEKQINNLYSKDHIRMTINSLIHPFI